MLVLAAETFVAALGLLIWWYVVLLCALFATWIVLRVVGVARNRRKAAVTIVPLIGLMLRAVRFDWLLMWVAIPILVFAANGANIPPPRPDAVRYGQLLFCYAFVVVAAVAIPRAYGVSMFQLRNQLSPRTAFAIGQMRFYGGVLVGYVVYGYPGPHGVFAVIAALAYGALLIGVSLRSVAVKRYADSPDVDPLDVVPSGELLLVQVSDSHITDTDTRVPMGGGASGLAQLRTLAESLIEGGMPPIVVVSGDLVDRGTAEEWERGMAPLRALKAAGACVVLAPGNHDVLPSYTWSGLLWAAVRPGAGPPVVDGTLVQRYFDGAVELEPRLQTHTGQRLQAYLEEHASNWNGLEAAWNAARDEAIARLGLKPDTTHYRALSKYRSQSAQESQALERRFIERVTPLYPMIPQGYWQRNLYTVSPGTVAEFFKGDPWHDKWYDPYPLILRPAPDIEILVLNSNPRRPLLGQSSLGECGEEQLTRLEQLLQSSDARTLIVIHHHACAAWTSDKKVSFGRWGILAHDPAESRRLFEILSAAGQGGRTIVLMTGHVHESSRYARVPGSDDNGFWYFESAALGEPGGAVRLGIVRDAHGALRPGIVNTLAIPVS